jgi:anaerobic magnesium-protoporphyrin IX monomethyl ester cyclase
MAVRAMSRAKVLLFNPRSEFYAMPLGLLAVGSALDPERYDVRIFDARIDANAEASVLEESSDAACVGMTVFSGPPISDALRLSRNLRKRHPQLPVIWGGWHPSILPEQCVASGAVDAVVMAQGEPIFRELVEAIDRRQDWPGIRGLCINVGGKPVRTPSRPMVRMDDLPAVRYDLLNVESYFRHKGRRQLDYSSSRGCPYKCTFCADPMVYSSKWTGLAPARIVSELKDLYERHRMEEVFFLDDDLFASLKRIQALADVFSATRIPFVWKGTARADELCRLPEDFFPRLREAGCVRINVGAESGSQKILDRIKKEYEVDEIVTAARRAGKAGISVSHSFITGFPGETEQDFQATLDVIKTIRRTSSQHETSVYFYSPYPGTEMVHELEKKGLRLPNRLEDWEHFNIEGAWLPRENPRFVKRIRNLNFYLRHGYSEGPLSAPRRLLRGISRWRCEHDWYGLGIERYLAENLRPHV